MNMEFAGKKEKYKSMEGLKRWHHRYRLQLWSGRNEVLLREINSSNTLNADSMGRDDDEGRVFASSHFQTFLSADAKVII